MENALLPAGGVLVIVLPGIADMETLCDMMPPPGIVVLVNCKPCV